MVQTCSAYGCKNRYHKDKDISFHKFPLARPELCGRWVAAMRRSNFKPTKYSNLCSQHFTQDSFKKDCNNRVLQESAVPSLFSASLSIKSESSEIPLLSEIHHPLSLAVTSDPASAEEAVGGAAGARGDTAAVCCDHNYTAEDSAQQQKRIEQLEEQLELLRRKLKSSQQKIRRQQKTLKRLRAAAAASRMADGYVILPKHIYHALKGSGK